MGSVCSSSSSSVVSRGRSPVNENNNNDMENGAKRPLPKQPKSKGASPAPAAARAPRRGSATSSLSSFGGAEIPGAVLGCVHPIPCSLLLTNSRYCDF